MTTLIPFIWLDDQAEAFAARTTEVFGDGKILRAPRYPEGTNNPAGKPAGSVMLVEFRVFGHRMVGLNGGPQFRPNPSVSFFFHASDEAEAKRVYEGLAEGGKVMMPLGSYPWSECYGWVEDRFGVSWQVITGQRRQQGRLATCLMYSGAVQSKAAEAMELYRSAFGQTDRPQIEYYAPGEGPTEQIKHGRFQLGDWSMVAMDSHVEHGFGFTEGVSLQVLCDGPDEAEHFRTVLGAGGSHSQGGWLKDRFGLSWQVVQRRGS